MTRILVLGAAGLLGINFAIEASKDHDVLGTLHRIRIKEAPFETHAIDLLDVDALPTLLYKTKADWVVNCVALADVDECEEHPELAQALNVDLPRQLAIESAKRSHRLVHISTDAVFDGQQGDYGEEDVAKPINAYGRSKLDGENAVLEVYPSAIVARVNFFGWGLTGKRSLSEFFYNRLSVGERVAGITDRYFSPLLVNDLSKLLLSMLQKNLSGLYHVASPIGLSKYEFGLALARRFSFPEDLVEPAIAESLDYKAPRPPDLSLNIDKIQETLGEELPDVHSGIDGLFELRQNGYADRLKAMAHTESALGDKVI